MAAGRLIIPGWSPAVDADGVPIPNAKMFFYLNKTTTLATVYSDMALTLPLSNPVLANAAGQWPAIWADDTNLFSVSIDAPYGPPGVPFTFDDLGPSTSTNTGGAANKLDRDGANAEPDLLPNIGAAPDTFKADRVPRGTIDKLVERVSVKDYGAFGDGASHTLSATTAFRGENTTGWSLAQWKTYFPAAVSLAQEIDFLAHEEALRQALEAHRPIEVFVPAGKYNLGTDGVVIQHDGVAIRGDGPHATTWLSYKPDGDIFTFRNMGAGGIFNGTIAAMVKRTEGSAVLFHNGHNLVSRDLRLDPGSLHGGPGDAEHWSGFDMTAGVSQFLYTVEDYELNNVGHGFRIGQTGGYVQDVWIGRGICVARGAGVRAYNVGGLYVYNMPDFLGCSWGLQCIPGAGQTVSGMMISGMLVDTCRFHGVDIQPQAGGSVVDFQMTDVWASSSGTQVPGGEASLAACGIHINGAAGYVGGGMITSPRCIGNVSNGIQVMHAGEITISNAQCNYNSVRSPGTFSGIFLGVGASNVSVVGGFSGPTGKFKQEGFPSTQQFGVFVDSGATGCKVIYADVTGNINPGVFNAGTNTYITTPGASINQPIDTPNQLGPIGVNRAAIPSASIATANQLSIGGFEPICGFNAYYDGSVWRYQDSGPAAALVAYAAGLTLVRFATNASGPDAAATIASSDLVATV